MSLTEKYRPKRFADVFGQEYAVRVLSQLILRGQIRMNILLHGSVGSGKTTLARIYGKALNCMKPEEDGSACGACAACIQFEDDNSPFWEEDGTRFGSEEAAVKQLIGLARGLPGDDPRIIFIDEAHALGKSLEVLLKTLEDPNGRNVFILATTEPNCIPRAVRSRLQNIEVKPLPIDRAVEFLTRIAAQEGIAYEIEALILIAGYSDGQPRDLLQNLDQARLGYDEVTLDGVKERLGITFAEALLAYFQALVDGSFVGLTKAYYAWNDSAQLKMRLVQSLLLSVYIRDVHHLKLIIEPTLDALRGPDRQKLVFDWTKRVGVDVFPRYLQGLLAFWPVAMPDQTDEVINLHFASFHDAVQTAPADSSSQRATSRAIHVRRRSKLVSVAPDPNYLSYEQARTIINRASTLTQGYGLHFNAMITLWHGVFGIKKVDDAAKLTTAFNGFVRHHLKMPGAASGYRLSLLGCDEARGFWTRMIVVVPPNRQAKLEAALAAWRIAERDKGFEGPAFKAEFRSHNEQRTAYQRKCVRWLCGGINPAEHGWDHNRNEAVSLLDLLKVPLSERRPFGNVGDQRRETATDALLPGALSVLTENKMNFLSAFDDECWNEVGGGWERQEFVARKQLIEQRALERAAVEGLPGKNSKDKVYREKKLAELIASWSDDPHNRERHWEVWWHTPDL